MTDTDKTVSESDENNNHVMSGPIPCSKEDMLMMLGEPKRVRNNERLFLYSWQEHYGYALGSLIKMICFLDIEFDENNIVKKYEFIRKGIFSTLSFVGHI